MSWAEDMGFDAYDFEDFNDIKYEVQRREELIQSNHWDGIHRERKK